MWRRSALFFKLSYFEMILGLVDLQPEAALQNLIDGTERFLGRW